ncbi:MAG: hypothetical protein OXF24_05785 [Hyphomicrobiales bacterium]|nr:hypothetical protein [Hyphomicrobiales bacterium]
MARTRSRERAREIRGASILMPRRRLREVRMRAERIAKELRQFERFKG